MLPTMNEALPRIMLQAISYPDLLWWERMLQEGYGQQFGTPYIHIQLHRQPFPLQIVKAPVHYKAARSFCPQATLPKFTGLGSSGRLGG